MDDAMGATCLLYPGNMIDVAKLQVISKTTITM